MSEPRESRRVDQSALKVNQAFIIGLLILSFILEATWLAAFVALVMLVGTVEPSLALFQQIYRRGLAPVGLVKPHVIPDNPEPHRFAQGFGGAVLLLALAVLTVGPAWFGWTLVWLIVGLAALNRKRKKENNEKMRDRKSVV